jgi:hypothetical protein
MLARYLFGCWLICVKIQNSSGAIKGNRRLRPIEHLRNLSKKTRKTKWKNQEQATEDHPFILLITLPQTCEPLLLKDDTRLAPIPAGNMKYDDDGREVTFGAGTADDVDATG